MREGRMRHALALSAPALTVLFVVLAGTAFDPYVQYVFGLCMVAMLIGAALVPLVGLARIVMLGSGAMIAIGAYVSSLLVTKLEIPFFVAFIFAAAAGGLAGFLLGLPAIRFRGHHLAMVTLVFQALGIIIIREWKSMTGGAEGMRVPPASLLGYAFDTDASNLVLIGVFAAISILLLTLLVRGRFGKTLRAIASTEIGSTAFGVHLGAYKVAAFTISCTFLAVAGAIIAPQLKIIDPESFGIMQSINALAYPIVGGMTSIWGGLVGGGLLRALPETLRGFAEYAEMAFSGLAVLTVLLLPGGLVSGVERVAAFAKRARTGGEQVSEVTVGGASDVATIQAEVKPYPRVDAGAAALQIFGISKRFGSLVAVADVSLSVPQGSIHGLIGPNGAGKTTLFNVVSGFIEPDWGEVKLFGVPSKGVAARNRIKMGVARTFQHVAIYSQLSLLDNVVIGLGDNGVFRGIFGSIGDALQGRDKARREDLAKAALDVVGLYGRRYERAGSLALGDQRRLEIARAIASRPKLLLLDEPVSGVAIDEERKLKDLLHALNAEWSLTMLLIEHNIRFVVDCCASLSVMHQGAIVVEGQPDQVIARQDVQEIYFGKV